MATSPKLVLTRSELAELIGLARGKQDWRLVRALRSQERALERAEERARNGVPCVDPVADVIDLASRRRSF